MTATNGYTVYLLYKNILELFNSGDFTIIELAQKTNSKYPTIKRIIENLRQNGIVKLSNYHIKTNKVAVYSLNKGVKTVQV